ncbi:transcription factor EB isoform X2 [Brachionus plicatilis]|uniref:Transcription factor EB isoform X2 n=1 Tax=Brachionus plicatilis TaxID=10195 RepID=A0A3M7SII6_BRAPC|nr:transcription factor EB isoform X2 [Brachionus plicatilis]
MLHHDQSKMIHSEFLYPQSDARFIEENMMDDLMITSSEHLNMDNTKQMMAQNFMSEDFYVPYANYGSQNSQYNFHTLQPSSQQYQYNGQAQYMNSMLQPGTTYSPKLITRTPSINSSTGSSSPSSVSSNLNSTNLDFEANKPDPAEMAKKKSLAGQKLTDEEMQLLIKDRQRKDNHNMIERRRRFNINDRIKELGELLPRSGEYQLCDPLVFLDFDTKQNKGSILKASVDFIQIIKRENDELRKREEFSKYIIQLNKKLCNRVKELESICSSNGIDISQNLNYNSQIETGDLSLGFGENIEPYNQSQNVIEIPGLSLEDNYFTTTVCSTNGPVRQKRVKHSTKKTDAKREKKDVKVPKEEPSSPKDTKQTDSLNEISSSSITSTPFIKLMTDNSKDPVLTSVSSPPCSPAKQNSTSYSNKSLDDNSQSINPISVSIPCMARIFPLFDIFLFNPEMLKSHKGKVNLLTYSSIQITSKF